MIRVADYIADFIFKQGVRDIFLVSGGGIMFLTDGLAKNKGLKFICNHHEQASAMAAVAYAKYTNNLGVAYITTGCGGTNAMTGLLNGWQDSIPCLFISGQVKRANTTRNSGLKLRQFGVQEADIIQLVEPLTKYAVMVNEPEKIAYHLEKAVYLAKSGRPGPVWLDIPLDVQGAMVDESKLTRFNPTDEMMDIKKSLTNEELSELQALLDKSERPIIVAGQGIRLSETINTFRDFVKSHNIPVVSSYLGVGVLPTNDDHYIGCIGAKGTRAGNFAIQNSDLVLVLGSHLSVSSIGYEAKKFARDAKVIVVDIDSVEHRKDLVRIDFFINIELKEFFNHAVKLKIANDKNWLDKCRRWKLMWPVCLPEYALEDKVNLYYFVDRLSKKMPADAVVISDAGSAFYATTQAINLKSGQRYITSGGQAEMGYTTPACIGVSVARKGREVLGITGDGSFQMNIQEMQTIIYNKLPIKLFVWNNNGYLSIRATQSKFFEQRLVGTDSSSGVSFPNLKKVADCYGLKYFIINNSSEVDSVIDQILAYDGPVLCEVMCNSAQEIKPTISSVRKEDGSMVSRPMEDMYPFLPREEFLDEMIIEPLEE
jgi:acetolactate synthase-1/2/3 large subunit